MGYSKLSLGLLGVLVSHLAPAAAQNFTSDPSRFKIFELLEAESGPCDLCTGPDDAIWAQNILTDTIARIDPQTGTVEEYPIPYDTPAPTSILNLVDGDTLAPGLGNRSALACAIHTGSDGNIYAAGGLRNQLVKIVPSTREITVLGPNPPNELGDLLFFNDMWTGPNGMFFSQTTANKVTYYHYDTGVFQDFTPPTPASGPLGMRIYSGDGNLWFTEFFGNKIAKLDFRSGEITEYPLPLPEMGPSVLRVEEGEFLWFVITLGNGLGRINTNTGKIDLYFSPKPLELPAEDDADRDGNIFFSAFLSDTINYYVPQSQEFGTITIPDGVVVAQALPPDVPIAMHYYNTTNTMWFALVARNQVGYYVLDPA
ncbi:hypothetical protein LTR85_011296 [Meristemomyces frigidus]|nr:hypothetical protein LTR85_011296 [Meristemomyces frigidus]